MSTSHIARSSIRALVMASVVAACGLGGQNPSTTQSTQDETMTQTAQQQPGSTEQTTTTGTASAQLTGTSQVTPGTLIRVEIEPCTGLGRQRATALAVGPDIAITAAHSFVTAESASLRFTDSSGRETTADAQLEVADLDKDIAVIRPAAPLALPWEAFVLGEPEIGDTVTVETYADADGPETKQAEVLRLVSATLDGEGRRAAIELEADIDPGDSGAPVLAPSGRAIGMIFASSRTSDRGWAVRSNELAEALDAYSEALAAAEVTSVGYNCPDVN